MNATLTQFLIDVVRGPLRADFARAPAEVLAATALSDALRAAVRDQDIAALYRAGAHPMALMYFARTLGWDNPRYYACLEGALNPAASGVAPRSSGPAPN